MASNGLTSRVYPGGYPTNAYPASGAGMFPAAPSYGSQEQVTNLLTDFYPQQGTTGTGNLAQLLQALLGNGPQTGLPLSGAPKSTPTFQGKAGNAVVVEVGYTADGEADEHAQSVMEVYKRYNPNGTAVLEGIDDNGADGAASTLSKSEKTVPILKNEQALNESIDAGASDALIVFSQEINQVVKKGNASVINGSLGYSRNEVYIDTLHTLQANPSLARYVGLQPDDIQNLEVDNEGVTTVTEKVAKAISSYVDIRLDTPNSAFQQARRQYQESTRNAAQHGIAVVVAAGNEHELNDIFPRTKPGGDTNFLAQSHDVIAVAASDDQDTPQLQDDTLGSFSSWGDGTYNPTIATDGVGVKTKFGPQDGTSFASPKAAAIIARMQQQNPNLSVAQIKAILQQTAVDTQASPLAEGAGMLDVNAALSLSMSAQRPFPMTAGYY